MPISRRGVQYKNTAELAVEYGYSEHHIRHLAREEKRKRGLGIPGFKIGRNWWLNAAKADARLVKDETDTESLTNDTDDAGDGDRYACLDDI